MPIKLLYITNGITGSGGLERVLSVKASMLADEFDYEVYILGLNQENVKPFYEFSTKIKFVTIIANGNPLIYFQKYRRELRATVELIQPDIISVCDDGLKGFFIPNILKTKAKIIYERHAAMALNTTESFKGKLIRSLMRRQAGKFDQFVVLTKGNVSEWDSSNVVVIPNPLSFSSWDSASLLEKRIIAVGSHSWNKGYDLLLRIWHTIEKRYPDWSLEIYGKLDSSKIFLKQAEELGLKQVQFLSAVKDIKSVYLSSSMLVLPSRSEGFGMVLIEAMECGVPCIAFDCPHGPADIISNKIDGLLVKNGSIVEFRNSMELLIEDLELRKNLGKQAKLKAKDYLAEHIVKQWDSLFKEMISL